MNESTQDVFKIKIQCESENLEIDSANVMHTYCEEDFVWSSLGTFEYNDDCLEEPKPHVIEVWIFHTTQNLIQLSNSVLYVLNVVSA